MRNRAGRRALGFTPEPGVLAIDLALLAAAALAWKRPVSRGGREAGAHPALEPAE